MYGSEAIIITLAELFNNLTFCARQFILFTVRFEEFKSFNVVSASAMAWRTVRFLGPVTSTSTECSKQAPVALLVSYLAARWSGVLPSRFFLLLESPASSRKWMSSMWQARMDRCRGVLPELSAASSSASSSTRYFMTAN